jgi:hypothetical protein
VTPRVVETPHCARCRELLALSVYPEEVVTVGGQRIRFRRHTDFVSCRRCHSLYRVESLREGRVDPVTDRELLATGEATAE